MVLALMIGNQAGWPIRSFAWPLGLLGLTALVGRACCFGAAQPCLPWRSLSPFFIAGLFFLLWSAWPAFKFGFNWISYVNQDFTNYCLSAQRFRDLRLLSAADPGGAGRHRITASGLLVHECGLAGSFWRRSRRWPGFRRSAARIRSASSCPRSWPWAWCKFLPPPGWFCTPAAGAGMRVGRRDCCLAFSPLFMLGCLYQLFAQVGGLALMLTLLALVTVRFVPKRRRALARQAVPPALVGGRSWESITPKSRPSPCVGASAFTPALWVTTRGGFRTSSWSDANTLLSASSCSCGIIFSPAFTPCCISTSAAPSLLPDLSMSVFPFLLDTFGTGRAFSDCRPRVRIRPIPTALDPDSAAGLTPARSSRCPRALGKGAAVRCRSAACSCWCSSCIALALKLFQGRSNDFGLYKLAMFIQPALMAALAYAHTWRRPRGALRRRTAPLAAAVSLLALTAPAGWNCTRTGPRPPPVAPRRCGFVELRNASALIGKALPGPALCPPAPTGRAASTTSWRSPSWPPVSTAAPTSEFISRDFFGTQTPLFNSDWWPLAVYPHRELFTYGGRPARLERGRDQIAVHPTRPRAFDANFVTAMRPGSEGSRQLFASWPRN